MKMDEKRTTSLVRAKELKMAIEDFQNFRKEYPLATSPELAEKAKMQKRKILEYFGATDEEWNNWQWQVKNRIHDSETLSHFMNLDDKEKTIIDEVSKTYRWATTPYYLSLMDWENRDYAINQMAIPTDYENDQHGETDPMDEEHTNPAACITRRYPNRLIINVTSACAMFCRHCQRRRLIGECDHTKSREELDEAIQYVRENEEIRDVLITGGDALLLSDETLEYVLSKLREIPHVEILRLGTRVPVTMPQRITEELVNMLRKYHPLYVNTQFNHPRELTRDSISACERLADAGIPLGNQMVFLKGINNDRFIVQMLNENLLRARVRPYYIFHPKQVVGTAHFQITVEEGLEIIKYLRGHTSGLAIPQYILNAPHGLGKVPLLPQYMVESDDKHVILHTWEEKEVNIWYNS